MMVFTRVLGVCCVAAALIGWSSVANADLLAYYSMEETGSPLVDQVGGQMASAVDLGHLYSQPGPGGFGNAVGLNAEGSWQLSEADSAELRDLTNDMSVAAWVYVDSAFGVELSRVMGDDAPWDADGWSWGVNGDVIRFTKNGIIDADDTASGVTVPFDRWTHLAVTVSSTDGIHYYMGGTDTGSPIANTADMVPGPGNNGMDDPYAIGRANRTNGTQWFKGNLDEVRVYNHVLTPEEVAALAIPEPATAFLLGLALLTGVAAVRRR